MVENAVIYCRVSTQIQKEKGYSLAEQELICAEYIANKKYRIVARIHEQISGATFVRPKMDEIIEMAKRNQIQVVVCLELDRFARGPAPMILLEDQLAQHGARVEYVLNNFAPTAEGQFMKTVNAGMAELERQKIKERMVRGKKSKARSGKVPHSGIPLFGYRHEDGYYIIREDEAAIVRQIFDWYVKDRLGFVTIATKLSEMRVLTRHDKLGIKRPKKEPGTWSQASVADLIHNSTYAGRNLWGKHSPYQPEPIEIAVPAIIDPELFEAAQRQAAENSKYSRRNAKNHYLLSGIMFCPDCGLRYVGFTSRRGVRYYRCGGVLTANKPYPEYVAPCPRHSVKAEAAEQEVWATIAKALKHPKLIADNLLAHRASYVDHSQEQLDVLQREIDKLTKQEAKLLNLYLEDRVDAALLSSKADEIRRTKANLEEQYDDILQKRQNDAALQHLNIEDVIAFCNQIADNIDLFDFAEKRKTLQLLQIRVVCNRREEPFDYDISGLIPSDVIDSAQRRLSRINYVTLMWVFEPPYSTPDARSDYGVEMRIEA